MAIYLPTKFQKHMSNDKIGYSPDMKMPSKINYLTLIS